MVGRSASGRVVAGRYRLDRLIGRGGAGAVWRGHDERLHRPVAVKEITFPSDGPQAEIGQIRALREARAAARLHDTGVVQIYDIIEDDDGAYLIMELVDAPNLSVLVRRGGPLQPRAVAILGVRVLDTLVAAHRAGIVHRDIKPSNVLVDGDVPRLTDFGIARLGDEATITSSGVVMGTPAYIAPEHARGEPVGPPADLYGLGATLYYAVEGTAPFGESSSVATVVAVLDRPPRPSRRAGPLAALLDALLVKDPGDRPNADAVRDRLVAIGRDAAGDPEAVAAGPEIVASTSDAVVAVDEAVDDTDEVQRIDEPAAPPPVDEDVATTEDAAAIGERAVPDDLEPPADDLEPPAEPGTARDRRRPIAVAVLAVLALALLAALNLESGDAGDDRGDDADRDAAAVAAASTSPAVRATAAADRSPTAGDPVVEGGTQPGAGPSASPQRARSPSGTSPRSDEPDPDGVLPAYDVDVPDDWVRFDAPDAPYSIAHPPGWEVIDRQGSLADIRDPRTGTYVRLDWVGEKRDPVDAWRTFEPDFAGRQTNYRRLELEATTFKGDRAALWEYRYGSSAAMHAYNLGVNAGDYGYGINLAARQSDFAEARRLWPYFLASHEFNP